MTFLFRFSCRPGKVSMKNTIINVKKEPHLASRTLALKVLSCSSYLIALEVKLLLEGATVLWSLTWWGTRSLGSKLPSSPCVA